MIPVKFAEANLTLTGPKGMPDCLPLPAHTNGEICTAVWKLDEEEKARLARSGLIAIGIYSGMTLPPYHMQVLDEGQSPYLVPCRPFMLKEPLVLSAKEIADQPKLEGNQQCSGCGAWWSLHRRVTVQCPKLVVDPAKGTTTITGFEGETFRGEG